MHQQPGNHEVFIPGYGHIDKRNYPHSGKRSNARRERFPGAKSRGPCPCGSQRIYRECCLGSNT
ncbi:MAG: SEC-C domain-containing protein [Planctomycetaceae bacterium]|nr:SEC-C domain-containing protein [Planctomycetaceae bacterium]